ncbi:ATPase family gene 2 protein homolog B-like isoform X2 [Rhodnius prolixus]|uniref:ATPase family gene 2 protein homolog B-like isoform X2 n=1 Tax=Rhodnius prolixus TaxID=13249 RepID=UPI003D18E084
MNFNVVTLPHTLFNLQKLYFSYGIHKELYARNVYVQLNDHKTYICKVYAKPLISSDMCLIDKTVFYPTTDPNPTSLSEIEGNVKITEIQTIDYIKKVAVTVIFTSVWDREKWVNNHLRKLVKQILQFFLITNNCVLNINKIKEFKKMGLSYIEVVKIETEGVGKVVNSTKIKIINCLSVEHYNVTKSVRNEVNFLRKPYADLEEVFMGRTRMQQAHCELPLPQVLLLGPAGCGKKTLVQQICNNTCTVLQKIDCSELCRPEPGETESLLKKKFEYALQLSKECMVAIFLLRLEVIGNQAGRILFQLNSLLSSIMYNTKVIVIAPTSNANTFHESLRSRFSHQIYIGPPNESERIEMLSALCKNMTLSSTSLDKIAKFTPGFVLADLALLVNRVVRSTSNVATSSWAINVDLFKKYATVIEPSALRGEIGIVKNNQEVEEIGGLEGIKKSLTQLIQWPLLHTKAFKSLNIKHPSGILLYGPPGCAKTSLVRAVAAESNITFLAVSAADLYSPYVGEAERTISYLFQRARAAAPTLLFIDEIDALVGYRGGRQKGAQERVLSAFLTEMDGVGLKESEGARSMSDLEKNVIVVAATNRPDVLDSAILRPGRLDRLQFVPPPNIHDRIDILRVLTKKIPLDKCVDLEIIATNTELFTGADLSNLCREAALEALTSEGMNVENIQNKHFITALKSVKPSITKNVVKCSN